mgnify:CR=1 FL=1
MMRLPPFQRPAHVVSASEHAWNGIVYSLKHQRVRTILLLFLAVGVFGWSYGVLMPAFARDVLGRGANGYGILMSASGTGAFIGALVVATYGHLFTARRLALGGVWLFSIALSRAFAEPKFLRSRSHFSSLPDLECSCFSPRRTRCCKRLCRMKCVAASWAYGRSFSAR